MSCGLMSPSGSLESAARWATASKPLRCAGGDVAQVDVERRGPRRGRLRNRTRRRAGVETDDLVASGPQDRHHLHADVPEMSCH